MSRRRSISTDISIDKKIARICGEPRCFTLALYMLMIPHSNDYGEITGNPQEILLQVIPALRWATCEDVEKAIQEMIDAELIERHFGIIYFPLDSFYRHQSYINEKRQAEAASRRISLYDKIVAQNTANLRETPQNPVSPSPSLSPSPSPFKEPPCIPPKGETPPVKKSTAKSETRKKSCQLPDNFFLDEKRKAYAAEKGMSDATAINEFDRFKAHHQSKASVFKDWDKAWQTWVMNWVAFGARQVAAPGQEQSGGEQWELKRQARRCYSELFGACTPTQRATPYDQLEPACKLCECQQPGWRPK